MSQVSHSYLNIFIKIKFMVYTIAEIGNNHNGSIKKFLKITKAAHASGADAVKIQSFRGTDIVAPNILSSEYPEWDSDGYKYWYEFADSIALPIGDHQEAIDYAHHLGLDFITTPVSPEIVDFLEQMKGIDYYKIASMDLNNIDLIESIAQTDKKIILSTGMGSIEEVKIAVDLLHKNNLTILHCVSDYPLNPQNANLNNIKFLINEFPNLTIGFSDHSLGHELSIAAVALGAKVIEKHFTLDREDTKSAEHHFSMEPIDFEKMVKWTNDVDKNFEKYEWGRSENENIKGKLISRRSFHYKKNFCKGHIISKKDLIFIRPGSGFDFNDISKIIGKKLSKDVLKYNICILDDFE